MKKNVSVTKIKIDEENQISDARNANVSNVKVSNENDEESHSSPIKISTPKPASYILIQNGQQRIVAEGSTTTSSVPTSVKPFSILNDWEITPFLTKVDWIKFFNF